MNNEDLFKAMGDTDGDLIERSEKKRTPNRALRIAAIAAAAVLVTGLAGSAAVKLWKTYGRQAESPPQLEPQIKPGTTIPPDPTPEQTEAMKQKENTRPFRSLCQTNAWAKEVRNGTFAELMVRIGEPWIRRYRDLRARYDK